MPSNKSSRRKRHLSADFPSQLRTRASRLDSPSGNGTRVNGHDTPPVGGADTSNKLPHTNRESESLSRNVYQPAQRLFLSNDICDALHGLELPNPKLAEVRHEQHDLDVLLLFFSRNCFVFNLGDRKRDVVQTNLVEMQFIS
jgi:hypothetical protein